MLNIKNNKTVPTVPTDTATGTVGWFDYDCSLNAEWCNIVQGELSNLANEHSETASATDNTQVVKAVKQIDGFNLIGNPVFRTTRANASHIAIPNATFISNRWKYHDIGTMVHDSSHVTNVNTTIDDYYYQTSLKLDTTTAQPTLGATDTCYIVQPIEGAVFRGYIYTPFVYSFCVKSTKTGTYTITVNDQGTGSIPNNTPTRSFVGTYTINAANTWERKHIFIPQILADDEGETGIGTTSTTVGISIKHVLCAGSTRQTVTPNVWQSGYFLSTTTSTNFCSTIDSIEFTGCQLIAGNSIQKFHTNQARDDLYNARYYQKSQNNTQNTMAYTPVVNLNGQVRRYNFWLGVRTAPIITLNANVANNAFPATVGTVSSVSSLGFTEQRSANATSNAGYFTSTWEADAELYAI